MASFRKHGNGWQVRIRREGHPELVKTFKRKTDGQAWAVEMERTIERGAALPDLNAGKRTLRQAVERYLTKTLPHKARNKDTKNLTQRLNWWADTLGDYAVSQITAAAIIEQRDALLEGRNPATVNRYISAIGALCRTMHKEWGWISINRMGRVQKLSEGRGRTRFLSDEERARLLAACKASESAALYPVTLLALSTGMRQGEIMGLTSMALT